MLFFYNINNSNIVNKFYVINVEFQANLQLLIYEKLMQKLLVNTAFKFRN